MSQLVFHIDVDLVFLKQQFDYGLVSSRRDLREHSSVFVRINFIYHFP